VTPENDRVWSRRSLYRSQDRLLPQQSPCLVVKTLISVAGSPTAGGRRRKVRTMEKIVAFAPMPNPIDTITAKTKPGDLENRRNAKTRSRSQDVMESSVEVGTQMSGQLFPHSLRPTNPTLLSSLACPPAESSSPKNACSPGRSIIAFHLGSAEIEMRSSR
jgi:hypothetical protein